MKYLSSDTLSPHYQFENFAVGSNSWEAFTNLQKLSKYWPYIENNPILLKADTGRGKTHLGTALAHAIQKQAPDAQICLLGAHHFINYVINANRENSLHKLRAEFAQLDVLIFEDLQGLTDRSAIQIEATTVFEDLRAKNKLLLITFDPSYSLGVDKNLDSFINSGKVLSIDRPTKSEWLNIARAKCREKNAQSIETSIIIELSQQNYHESRDVRIVEGAINRLSAFHAFMSVSEIPDRTP